MSFCRAGAALFIAASLVACSGGTQSIAPLRSNDGHTSKNRRHTMSWNVGMTQPVAVGLAIIPLTLTVNGTVGTVGTFGTTGCAAPSGPNPCPNINFTASPPQYYSALDVPMTLGATTLSTQCVAPAGAATPAPGFTPACYVVTYEGGAGPYVLQGPLTSSGSSLSVPGQSSTIYFEGLTPYNVFLEYVTSISSPPPALTPSPAPSPTEFATPTPVPTPTPTPILTPSPCPSSTSADDDGEHDDAHRARTMHHRHGGDDGGDDDGGSCSTPSPMPSPTCTSDDDGGHHHRHSDNVRTRGHHHGDDDDCGDDD